MAGDDDEFAVLDGQVHPVDARAERYPGAVPGAGGAARAGGDVHGDGLRGLGGAVQVEDPGVRGAVGPGVDGAPGQRLAAEAHQPQLGPASLGRGVRQDVTEARGQMGQGDPLVGQPVGDRGRVAHVGLGEDDRAARPQGHEHVPQQRVVPEPGQHRAADLASDALGGGVPAEEVLARLPAAQDPPGLTGGTGGVGDVGDGGVGGSSGVRVVTDARVRDVVRGHVRCVGLGCEHRKFRARQLLRQPRWTAREPRLDPGPLRLAARLPHRVGGVADQEGRAGAGHGHQGQGEGGGAQRVDRDGVPGADAGRFQPLGEPGRRRLEGAVAPPLPGPRHREGVGCAGRVLREPSQQTGRPAGRGPSQVPYRHT